jgi:hypothetical protein
MTDTSARTLPIDARVIARDETDNYHILDGHRKYIKAILGVYLYDKNEITHCCEFTPSYYLRHVYDTVVLTDAGAELSEAGKDEIFERYENCGGEDIYVHCSGIDAMEKNKARYHVHGETGVSFEDTSYDEQMESLLDHFRGNCPF